MISQKHDFAIEDTLPKLLIRNYKKYGSREVALREKLRGRWRRYTWTEYYELVKYLTIAFIAMGLKPGERVSIIGENKPHVYWFELAAQSAGAIVVGVFSDCTAVEVEYFLGHSDSRFVVCQDQEQVDKVLEIKNKVPALEKVIYWDPKGLWGYKDNFIVDMDKMLELGRSYEKEHQVNFEEYVAQTKADATAFFFYSSGTTGQPKAAIVTQKTIIGMARSLEGVENLKKIKEYLSFLPIAWIPEQLFGVACSLIYEWRVNFPEKSETVQENIREIGPHFVFFGARLWENLIRTVQANIMNSSWLHRFFFNTACRIGYRITDFSMRGQKVNPFLLLLYFLADVLVFRSLRDNLGLLKSRIAFSAGASVSPDLIRFFHAIGVNLKQAYGGSEVGIISWHRDHDIKPESSGLPLPHVEIKISEEGEILTRSLYMFSGYYKQQGKTANKTDDGWYRTGDFGLIDKDGHLVVMDRMENLSSLAGGYKFSPQYCEIRLRFSPYIKDVLIVARPRETFIGALINIDFANVSQWAELHQIPYTTFADLSQKPEIIELVREEVAKVNDILPDYSRIRRFINLNKEFDPDEAELTRSRKLRRTFVEERFKEMIEAIFSEKDSLEVTSRVVYRDGRFGTSKSTIKVNGA